MECRARHRFFTAEITVQQYKLQNHVTLGQSSVFLGGDLWIFQSIRATPPRLVWNCALTYLAIFKSNGLTGA